MGFCAAPKQLARSAENQEKGDVYKRQGVQEPLTSLGRLISEGAGTLNYGTLWQLAFPLFFFVVTMFAFFFVGDGLRDALDPKDR